MVEIIFILIALIPEPPVLECQVELSEAAQMNWQSHDAPLVCSNAGYLAALGKGNHAAEFTPLNLACLCSKVPNREPFRLPECDGHLFCDLLGM